MPYTIVYTEAPKCAWCGKPMKSWIAFAEVHYHDECWRAKCNADMDRVFYELKNKWLGEAKHDVV